MKRIFFILCFLLLWSCYMFAQLQVVNGGNVHIGTTTGNARLNVLAQPYANSSFAIAASLPPVLGAGSAIYATSSSNSYIPTLYSKFAGFFEGNVYVSGQLISPAGINSSLPSDLIDAGDEGPETQRLQHLQLVKYIDNNEVSTTVKTSYNTYTNSSAKHYCIPVNLLRNVYPELVYDDDHGNMGINYLEMVPILVQAINELSAKIEEQQAEIAELKSFDKSKAKARSATGISTAEGQVLSLGQNNPNPFSESTSIEVCVPEEITNAALFVYDMSGAQVEKTNITERGTSRVSFSGTGLKEGMYLYSLVADGRVVGTKKMVLTK